MPGGMRDVWMKVTLVLEPLLRDLRGECRLMLRDGYVVDREDLLKSILKMEIYRVSYHSGTLRPRCPSCRNTVCMSARTRLSLLRRWGTRNWRVAGQ